MKVALIVPPDAALRRPGSNQASDGIGAIASLVSAGLAERGHKVHLFAPGDSDVAEGVILEPTIPVSFEHLQPRLHEGWPFVDEFTRARIAKRTMAAANKGRFDVIHGQDAWLIREGGHSAPNMFSTIHTCVYPLPVDALDRQICKHYPHHPVVTVSKSQQGGLQRNWLGHVYNATDVSHFTYRQTPEKGDARYLFWMGRICPDKGSLIAIKTVIALAKRGVKIKLKMAGGASLGSHEYFATKVQPYLDAYPNLIEYVGLVGHEQKNGLYGGAVATLCPLGLEEGGRDWYEPFGNVLIESLSCGTPVIVGNKASGPEIIKNGITGVVAPVSLNEEVVVKRFADGVEQILSTIGMRKAARRDAEAQWDVSRMVDEYEALYLSFATKRQVAKRVHVRS